MTSRAALRRIRKCAHCGHHYESRARTPRKLLRMLRECGASAHRMVEQLHEISPLTDLAAQAYLAEQLQERVAEVHKQLIDRLFSVCGFCCDRGCVEGPKHPASLSGEPAQAALAAVRAQNSTFGKLVRFAGAPETPSQLSLAHIGGNPCSPQEPLLVGKQHGSTAPSEVVSLPSSRRGARPRKLPPS